MHYVENDLQTLQYSSKEFKQCILRTRECFFYSLDMLVNKVGCRSICTSCLIGKAVITKAGGLRFKSYIGQIGHSVANSSPLLRQFFKRNCVVRLNLKLPKSCLKTGEFRSATRAAVKPRQCTANIFGFCL